jgi:hypothetical protein
MKNSLLETEVPLDVAMEFCQDEGILDNLREKHDQFGFNSPFITDKKRRCSIGFVNKNGASYLVFNDFIARAKLDDDLYKGSFFKFVKLIKDFSTVEEAAFYIYDKYLLRYDFSRPQKAPVKVHTNKAVSLRAFEPLMISVHGDYIRYLKTRGIDWDLISQYNVFVDRDQKRIVFPVYEDGIPIYYNSRSILKWVPKEYRWLKSEVEHNAYPLWNLENVVDEIWLFEGVFDGIFWKDKAVAYFGAIVTDELIAKMKKKNPSRVVLIGQNPFVDKAASVQRLKILERLKDGKLNVGVFNWRDIKEKDLNEAVVNGSIKKEEVENRIVPWDDYSKALNLMEML